MSSSSVSYAVVLSNEDEEAANLPVGVAVDDRVRTTCFTHIQEANDCTWHDDYYDNKHGIIAAFDRDTELVQKYCTKLRFAILLSFLTIVLINIVLDGDNYFGWIFWLCYFFFFYRFFAKAQKILKDQHVAISTEGIRIDNSTYLSVTIPFDQIVTIEAFPQKFCWCHNAGFESVRIHRRPTEAETAITCRKTLKIYLYGIQNADAFVRLLNALKADGGIAVAATATLPAASVEIVHIGKRDRCTVCPGNVQQRNRNEMTSTQQEQQKSQIAGHRARENARTPASLGSIKGSVP